MSNGESRSPLWVKVPRAKLLSIAVLTEDLAGLREAPIGSAHASEDIQGQQTGDLSPPPPARHAALDNSGRLIQNRREESKCATDFPRKNVFIMGTLGAACLRARGATSHGCDNAA